MPSKEHRAWMKFYPADFVIETTGLSAEETGGYILLIAKYWSNGGPFLYDDEGFERIVRLSPKKSKILLSKLSDYFEVSGGKLCNPKLDEFLAESAEAYRKRAEAGRMGGKAKLKQTKSNANAMPNQSESETESDSSIEESPQSPPRGDCSEEFEEFWDSYPSKRGKDAAIRAFRRAMKEGAILEDLLEAVERYKQSKPENIEYCNPARWLREGRWKDESPVIQAKGRLEENFVKDCEMWLRGYKPGRVWPNDWGPRPEERGCKVPKELLDVWRESLKH